MYAIGQKFEGAYPPDAAIWCNENGAMIARVDGGFEIQGLPQPTLEDQLAAVKSYYAAKLAALDTSMINALWADGGTQEATTRTALATKRQKTLAERSAAIQALTQQA